MSFYQTIINRKSTRNFTAQKLNDDLTTQLKKSALLAPTGKRKNHWDFIFIQQDETLKELARCKPHGAQLIEKAALAVVVIGDQQQSDTWIEDCSIASIFIQLQAQDMELGSCWVQIDKREHDNILSAGDFVKSLLEIPQHKSVLSIIAIGYPAKKIAPASEKALMTERIHSEKFGQPG